MKWIIAISILVSTLLLFQCGGQDIDLSNIPWITDQADEINCDSIGCHIWSPGKSFTSTEIAMLWERKFNPQTNGNWTILDTFFFADQLTSDPFLVLAQILGVPSDQVCSAVSFSSGVLTIPVGKIFYDSTFEVNQYAIIVDTLNHPGGGHFQMSFVPGRDCQGGAAN